MKNQCFSMIKAHIIKEVLSTYKSDIYQIIKKAYMTHAKGKTHNPPSYFLGFKGEPQKRIIALPASIQSKPKAVGIKWIASNPENIKNNLPRASAVIILNDYETGFPIACMEGSLISAIRTAYSAVLATKTMRNTKKNFQSLGIIGTGLIAENTLAAFIGQNINIAEINLYDQTNIYAKKFKEKIQQKSNFSININDTYAETIQRSEIILFTTTNRKPYISDRTLFNHSPLVLHLSLRDLDPVILKNANNVVDDIEHITQANTSVDLLSKQLNSNSFINGTLGDLLQRKIYLDDTKPTIFSPMGLGLLDIAVASYVYQKLCDDRRILKIYDFFI